MALSNLTVKVTYQGDGSNTTFAIPYQTIVNDSSEVRVWLRDETDPEDIIETLLEEGSLNDYLLTGAVLPTDFDTDVEMNVAPTLNQKLVIFRELPLTQTLTIPPDGPWNANNLNKALDRVVAMIQQVNNQFTRVPMLSVTEQSDQLVMPDPVALQFLRWDEDGLNLENVDISDVVSELIAEAGALPLGGDTGDLLEKVDAAPGNAVWGAFPFVGFSGRFNEALNFPSMREFIYWLADITYTAPLISLTASGSGTIREKGTAVVSSNLAATTTKRTDPIAAVRFYKDGVLIDTVASPDPDGGVETFGWTGSFTDYTFFRAQVDDDGTDPSGPTTVSSNVVEFIFVYPYYVGADVASLTAAQVRSNLTMRVINSTASVEEDITAANGDVFYFAYPASYGALTSILDINGFETFPDWTLRTENITGLDTTAVSYRIYEFNNTVASGDYQFTFIR